MSTFSENIAGKQIAELMVRIDAMQHTISEQSAKIQALQSNNSLSPADSVNASATESRMQNLSGFKLSTIPPFSAKTSDRTSTKVKGFLYSVRLYAQLNALSEAQTVALAEFHLTDKAAA